MPTNSNSANRRLIPALLVAVKLQDPAGSSPAMPLETARCCRAREVPFPQREIRGVLFTQVLPGNGDCQKRGRHCRRLSDTASASKLFQATYHPRWDEATPSPQSAAHRLVQPGAPAKAGPPLSHPPPRTPAAGHHTWQGPRAKQTNPTHLC